MEFDLERYSFACCIACKQIELCEGLSPFATFFLQSFSLMDPFDCKNMERAENKWLIFHITLYFQSFLIPLHYWFSYPLFPCQPREKEIQN